MLSYHQLPPMFFLPGFGGSFMLVVELDSICEASLSMNRFVIALNTTIADLNISATRMNLANSFSVIYCVLYSGVQSGSLLAPCRAVILIGVSQKLIVTATKRTFALGLLFCHFQLPLLLYSIEHFCEDSTVRGKVVPWY